MGELLFASDENLRRAADLLASGELVCFPTETVYGVGADASNVNAVRRIFEAKGRPADHPLILHLPNVAQLDEWAADVPDSARRLADAFWPGPLTLVLRRAPRVPPEVTGGQETVALRVPAHPVALGLLARFGSAVAAPSANRFGRISPTSAEHAAEELGSYVALTLDGGPAEVGVESSIVDLSGEEPRLLRPGGVGRDRLERILGTSLGSGSGRSVPRVPGALASHYAPSSGVELLGSRELLQRTAAGGASVLALTAPPEGFSGRWLQLPADPSGYARRLYASLRDLDRLGRPILVETPPAGLDWEAVNDRLRRAAAGRRSTSEGQEE